MGAHCMRAPVPTWFLLVHVVQLCVVWSAQWALSLGYTLYDCPALFSEKDEEQEALPSLDKPGWYSQGNAVHLYELLKKMTGRNEPKVFFG